VPSHGNIACGYFITTLMRDAGIPVQRAKLAQQTTSAIIHKLCKNKAFNPLAINKTYWIILHLIPIKFYLLLA
jgi:hypothetical protein